MLTVSVAAVHFPDTQVNPRTASCFISCPIVHTAACKLTQAWLEPEPAEVWRAVLYKWYVIEKKGLHATSWLIMITYPPTRPWLHNFQYQNLQFPSCSKQFSFLADCFIARTLRPINKHLLSHDSDKWKPPLHPYEIVYPQKLLTWRYEKLGCPGIYHIALVQCHSEMVKWLCQLLHFSEFYPAISAPQRSSVFSLSPPGSNSLAHTTHTYTT